jgi:hypothetical protein
MKYNVCKKLSSLSTSKRASLKVIDQEIKTSKG